MFGRSRRQPCPTASLLSAGSGLVVSFGRNVSSQPDADHIAKQITISDAKATTDEPYSKATKAEY